MKSALKSTNELSTDYKAVAKAAEIIENELLSADQVLVLPRSGDRRSFSKEINNISTYFSETRLADCLRIDANREGFYDMLPEGLFHEPYAQKGALSEEDMIRDVQQRREEEKHARTFFMPFEAELYNLRILLERYESRLDKKTTFSNLTGIFRNKWPEFDLFDRHQSIIWMHFLPVIHEKRNDLLFLGQLLQVLFSVPVSVQRDRSPGRKTRIDEPMQFRLGSGTLGVDCVAGDTFDSDDDLVLIHIGPCPTNQLLDFLPDGINTKITDLATSYLLPFDTAYEIILEASAEDRNGSIGSEQGNAYLGFTMYL
ncbi:type VI secretion system baseplate subunit TssG [Pedobacter sp. SYP-B3415]|uniref:type VI secretion system baseplate subunit TssG n=1 Tax=Pedobacter sp. SYP-B3415 TaxID=2496641 RepID=UPI00101CC990|nr:type VI secretion system baseplate subunit TssG [Pedobacter sp. SYP-B3415]